MRRRRKPANAPLVLIITAPPPLPNVPTPPADCSVALYGDSILHGAYNGATGEHRLAEPPAAALKRFRPAFAMTDNTVSGQSARTLAIRHFSEFRRLKAGKQPI